MVKFGYKLMSEEHGPAELVRNARRAEEAGFDFAAISDHYLPLARGAGPRAVRLVRCSARSAQATTAHRPDDGGDLPDHALPPGDHRAGGGDPGAAQRTTASRSGLGAGERLNEHVVGAGLAGRRRAPRAAREAVDIIQGLLGGALIELPRTALPARPRQALRPADAQAAGHPGRRRPRSRAAGREEGRRPDRHRGRRRNCSQAYRRPAARGRAMPRSRCAAADRRAGARRRRTSISAGRSPAGRCWPSCRTRRRSPPRRSMSPWRPWARR